MRKTLLFFIVFFGFHCQVSAQNGPITYPIIFSDNFENRSYSESIWTPNYNYNFVDGKTGNGISMVSTGGSVIITTPITIDTIKGGEIALMAHVKAENISQPPNPWNGIKAMFRIVLNDGTTLWPQIKMNIGTFDWISGSVLASIPENTLSVTLYLGLENCSGKVWFDDILIKLVKHPASLPPARDPAIPINKFHKVPSLRGAMVSNNNFSQNDALVLGEEWNANVIRWQIGGTYYLDGLLTPDYDPLLENELTKLDNALTWCKQSGLLIIADLHSLSRNWQYSLEAQDRLVSVWKTIASRYKDEPTVWAYDLANEPNPNDGHWEIEGLLIWEDLAEKIARGIRKIDAEKPIIIEPLFSIPQKFNELRPLDFSIPNIIYSTHMYEPHAFTHQTLYNYTQTYSYPGTINGVYWDKSQLVTALDPVLEFQNKFRVPILIGEFSAIRWAPSNSAYYYLKDCIEIFEEYDWDWCYHAFREWNGWSVEHSEDMNDPNPTPTPNQRQLLLRSYFEQNAKPTSIRQKDSAIPVHFELKQNYPNPFNSETKITFNLPQAENIIIEVFNTSGQKVETLLNKKLSAGSHTIAFKGLNYSNGVYFYKLTSDKFIEVKKMILIR